ncbi:MAG TPA: oligosaccharide flippase family protein [Thermomicrobiaceae bacterium]|nr:oligosaccharide flippase family protein [Thermomicrobiaceae bacterium]
MADENDVPLPAGPKTSPVIPIAVEGSVHPWRSRYAKASGLLDPITHGWALLTGASFARLAVGMVASVVVARALGPATLGSYALLASIAAIAGAVADLGLSEAAVTRIAPWYPHQLARARRAAGAFFWLRAGSAAGLVLLLSLAVLLVPRSLLPLDRVLLLLALAGVVATALSGAVSALLQASGNFGRLALVMLTNALLTALLALLLRAFDLLTLTSALVVLGIGTSLACFAVGRRLLPRALRLGLRPPRLALPALRAEARALLGFGLWIWLANSLAMLTAQLDLLLAAHWLAPAALGSYALAGNLAGKVDVINQSLHAALLPAASSLSTRARVRGYLRRGLIPGALVAALALILAPFARPLIIFVFGAAYRDAVALFLALLVVAVFDVFAAPLLLLPFAARRPRLLAAADGLRAVTLLAAAVWLVPPFGAFGLVAAKLLSRVAGLLLTVGVLAAHYRPRRAPAASSR